MWQALGPLHLLSISNHRALPRYKGAQKHDGCLGSGVPSNSLPFWAATISSVHLPPLSARLSEDVAWNDKGNKVTETIFTGSREFIMLVDSGEIISQSPKPWSVSGAGLNTYRVCLPTSYRMWSQLQGNIPELAGGLQLCRASRKLLADSEWGNQGDYQTQ
jgi:hypothetical protein